jgi:hypothetical protein
VVVNFVDIDGIVDHHCLKCLFIIVFTLPEVASLGNRACIAVWLKLFIFDHKPGTLCVNSHIDIHLKCL